MLDDLYFKKLFKITTQKPCSTPFTFIAKGKYFSCNGITTHPSRQ